MNKGLLWKDKWENRLERKVRKASKRLEISWRGDWAVMCGPGHFVNREMRQQSEQALKVRAPFSSGDPLPF